MINNELPGDYSYERITIVITDVDDQIPKFNEPVFHLNVSEDIGEFSSYFDEYSDFFNNLFIHGAYLLIISEYKEGITKDYL